MTMTIAGIFDLTVSKFPNKDALYDVRKDLRFTYREWSLEVNKLANALLQQGVRKGDRVTTYLYNTEELATAYFACASIGAVFNPINFRLMSEEVAFILQDAEPKVVIFEESLESGIRPIADRFPHIAFWFIDEHTPAYANNYHKKVKAAPSTNIEADVQAEDIYAIMYTSGTTGRPKGVLHRHRDMAEQSLVVLNAVKYDSRDNGLVTAPMFHCAELHCAFLPRVHIGAKNTILHQFDAKKVLELIHHEKITKLFAAPTMWNMLLQEDLNQYNLESLDTGLYGAAPMAPALIFACREKLGVKLVQAYGMTEMGPAITFLGDDDQICKSGSAGQACLNHEIRIVVPNEEGPSNPNNVVPAGETGEIIVRGPSMMKGYFNREESSKNALVDGWYLSGDIGYLDDEGFLYVKDRVDDMIISGGENIYPREVEDVLHSHEGVLDVAVLGQPDDHWGELVTAFVVKKDSNITEEELDQLCKSSEELANFKRPRKYIFCEALPRNASGKIQKFLLRKQMESIITE
ncbi:fatty acid--CoA ligase [Cytobacillus purgationiresistens]|uniref:Fatty-acyl-CoA synthase n=1 Tax=Cytobacillus purgationiresistens TaxID=863449 RepID=A0ABU0AN49_9BACI|nr:fatty acid--CoA ligase [Cytobacillus purgationiresistens]MDQ0272299.1 fatty-acyl-CoA synthase [Cytobacillus purgationiresistens]